MTSTFMREHCDSTNCSCTHQSFSAGLVNDDRRGSRTGLREPEASGEESALFDDHYCAEHHNYFCPLEHDDDDCPLDHNHYYSPVDHIYIYDHNHYLDTDNDNHCCDHYHDCSRHAD